MSISRARRKQVFSSSDIILSNLLEIEAMPAVINIYTFVENVQAFEFTRIAGI
jgi:hypothetical protein